MGVTAKAIGRFAITVVDRVLGMATLTVIVVVVAFAGYALWDSNQIYSGTDQEYYSMWKPDDDNGQSFAELQGINPEVIAWLTVYGTTIDYPVTQADDNMKYVNTNSEGRYSLAGSIFLDRANKPDFSDVNSILYGHHMERGVMFAHIGRFSDAEMFATHQYGNLYFDGTDHGMRFLAFVHTDAYDLDVFTPGVPADKRESYVDRLLAKATHQRDLALGPDARLILLSTCSARSTNGRDVLVGVITDQVYDDPYLQAEGGEQDHAQMGGVEEGSVGEGSGGGGAEGGGEVGGEVGGGGGRTRADGRSGPSPSMSQWILFTSAGSWLCWGLGLLAAAGVVTTGVVVFVRRRKGRRGCPARRFYGQEMLSIRSPDRGRETTKPTKRWER